MLLKTNDSMTKCQSKIRKNCTMIVQRRASRPLLAPPRRKMPPICTLWCGEVRGYIDAGGHYAKRYTARRREISHIEKKGVSACSRAKLEKKMLKMRIDPTMLLKTKDRLTKCLLRNQESCTTMQQIHLNDALPKPKSHANGELVPQWARWDAPPSRITPPPGG